MALLLQRSGYQPTDDPEQADVLVVNTCGFIALARAESLETLRALGVQVRPDQKLIAAGCWAQREPETLLELVPQLDAVIGTPSWNQLPALIGALQQRSERLNLH
jgi:ribosomal protein S12 methylthiotransferase